MHCINHYFKATFGTKTKKGKGTNQAKTMFGKQLDSAKRSSNPINPRAEGSRIYIPHMYIHAMYVSCEKVLSNQTLPNDRSEQDKSEVAKETPLAKFSSFLQTLI